MAYWYCKLAPKHPIHGAYHDTEYGFPTTSERALFERLSLEIMQAGLSWEIVLKKRKALNKAFDDFKVDKVAAFDEDDVRRLMYDADIIRNRRKIEAIIDNAKTILVLRKSHKGFARWLAAHQSLTKAKWIKLFRKTFKFSGPEIVGEFLMSIGILPGAHARSCAIYKKIEELKKQP